MADGPAYGSPTAFRRALTDRLKTVAKTSRWPLPQLQRQIAHDRLLTRLYLVDRGWIVKGAVALLARDLGVRATIDVDVYRDSTRELAGRELRAAASRDIGDWFRFELGAPRTAGGGARGTRVPVAAYVGTTPWAQFHVDVVGSEVGMTGAPEDVRALMPVAIPDVEPRGYLAYPLVDHVADKVAATFDRYGDSEAPSTRYKDLVDLVAIVTRASIAAEAQMAALASEAKRRPAVFPRRFEVPARDLWERGYAAEADRSLLPRARTLDEALAVVRPFLDPLLDGTAAGTWDPRLGRWVR